MSSPVDVSTDLIESVVEVDCSEIAPSRRDSCESVVSDNCTGQCVVDGASTCDDGNVSGNNLLAGVSCNSSSDLISSSSREHAVCTASDTVVPESLKVPGEVVFEKTCGADISSEDAVAASLGLPTRPRRPLNDECCGSGCTPCVFDLYERDLAAWCRRLRDAETPVAVEGGDSLPLSVAEFRPCVLLSVTSVSAETAVYRFQLPDGHGRQRLMVPVGWHLLARESSVTHESMDGGEAIQESAASRWIVRAYTPVTRPDEDRGFFDVYVRPIPGGLMSRMICDLWRPGHMTWWRGPVGGYRIAAGYTRLVLLGAGTGIAPLLHVVRDVLLLRPEEEEETRLRLLLASRSLSQVFPRQELLDLQGYWNFRYSLYISSGLDPVLQPWYGEDVHWRRIEESDVRAVVDASSCRTRYLVCGTTEFVKDMVRFLLASKCNENDIFRF